PRDARTFVADTLGSQLVVLDRGGRRVATVKLGGEAGDVQYDAVDRRIVANGQTRNELLTVDPATLAVTRRIHLPGCRGPHGLARDAARSLAFAACAGNGRIAAVNLRTARVTSLSGVGRSPDVAADDPVRKRVYVAAENGELAVLAEGGGHATKLGQAFVAAA